jgi:hypothetical protein
VPLVESADGLTTDFDREFSSQGISPNNDDEQEFPHS